MATGRWSYCSRRWHRRPVLPPPIDPVKLDPESRLPATMVRIPGFTREGVNYADYFMDRYEVTNREYKAFVDAGGYGNRTYWTHPFLKGGTEMAWDEAMALFKDETGRTGPSYVACRHVSRRAGRSSGRRRQLVRGRRLCPVRREGASDDITLGAGTAILSGGQLDYRAAQQLRRLRSEAGRQSRRPERVGALRHRRKRPRVVLQRSRLRPRDARRGVDGRYIPCGMDHPERTHSIATRRMDSGWCGRSTMPPRSDGCDNRPRRRRCGTIARKSPSRSPNSPFSGGTTNTRNPPPNAVVEATDDFEHWVRVKVAFDLPYGGERGGAYLFLPRNAQRPLQTVIYWPHGGFTTPQVNRRRVPERLWISW